MLFFLFYTIHRFPNMQQSCPEDGSNIFGQTLTTSLSGYSVL